MSRFLCALLAVLTLAACQSAQPKPAAPTRAEAAETTESETPPLGELAKGEPSSSLPVEADDLMEGNAGADVTIVAFLDFECPYCMKGFEALEELRAKYSLSQLRVVLKHMPLEFHKSALPAALAAQAVQLAGGPKAGFDFARALFQGRDLSSAALLEEAKKLGVERNLYTALLEDESTRLRVRADMELGQALGVTGTPAFFVNGRLIAGAVPLEEFDARVAEEIAHFSEARSAQRAFPEIYQARIQQNMRKGLVELVLGEDRGVNRVPIDGSPEAGPKTAPLTMVAFSDFECPYCKRADDTVLRLKAQYGESLRLVWKHLPLPFHKSARPAARLAELVHERLGDAAFFQVARSLFESAPRLDDATLTRVGEGLGLKTEEVEAALRGERPSIEARLSQDADLAEDLAAHGTPAFFINGRRVLGARPIEHFQAVLDAELSAAQERIKQGTPPADLYEATIMNGATPGVPEFVPTPSLTDAERPVWGPAQAPVTIHVFSDFECPFCRRAETLLADFKNQYKNEVRWVWHDLPLPFHKHAMPAARAGREAFRQQGSPGFWKMHELLFGLKVSASLVEDEHLSEHATSLKLRPVEFTAALSGKFDASIAQDQEMADKLGISGTPAFVIQRTGATDGFIVSGAQPPRQFERLVVRLLKN